MATTVADLEVYAGETITINGTVQDSSATAVNLTGYTGSQLTWKLSRKGATVASVEVTLADDISITVAADGTFAIDTTLPTSLTGGDYAQHMVVTDNSGNTDVIWKGYVDVEAIPASPA